MELAGEALLEKKLYKFRSIARDSTQPERPDSSKLHYVERIFLANELYFPSPIELNDPLESRPNLVVGNLNDSRYKQQYVDYVKHLILETNPNAKQEDIEHWLANQTQNEAEGLAKENTELYRSHLEKYRICSFCATATNPLVWSHYADSHKGFCLVFDADNEIFGGALKVHYQEDYPILDVTEQDDIEILRHSALVKYTDWKYEQEYRLVSMEPNEPEALPVKSKKFVFPPDMLSAVIFGCRISKPDTELIVEWCQQRGGNVQLKQAVLSDTKYDLTIIDL